MIFGKTAAVGLQYSHCGTLVLVTEAIFPEAI